MSHLFSAFLSPSFFYGSWRTMLGKVSTFLNVAIGIAVLGICIFFVLAHFRFERKQK